MAEGTAKDKDELNMNDNTALARATSANFLPSPNGAVSTTVF
jgi:hypothetical protein